MLVKIIISYLKCYVKGGRVSEGWAEGSCQIRIPSGIIKKAQIGWKSQEKGFKMKGILDINFYDIKTFKTKSWNVK